jgi:glutamate dehydrogenase/leucine dehydrogenase
MNNHESFYNKVGLSKGIKDKTFNLQGFGNVGYWAGKFFSGDGGKITTIVEYNSAIHNPAGINPDDAKKWFTQHGSFAGRRSAISSSLLPLRSQSTRATLTALNARL